MQYLIYIWCMAMTVTQQTTALKRSAPANSPLVRSNSPRPRVIQGQPDHKNEYPFVVSLETDDPILGFVFRICTGSLITSQWVLSAAHCLGSVHTIRYGDMTIPRNETKHFSKVLKQIPHPSYLDAEKISKKVHNDIALLLVEEIQMKKLGRLHTADYKTFIGRACRYAGFGFMDLIIDFKTLQARESAPLQIGEGVIYGNKDITSFNPVLLVFSRCDKRMQISSNGDSGGPLFIDKRIVGVLSGGENKNTSNYKYNGYVPVSPYLAWITRIIGEQ